MDTEDKKEELKDWKLLEILIDKIIKKLEESSCEPKVQDALKAIQLKQKFSKTSQAEKIFWQEIEEIRKSELERSKTTGISEGLFDNRLEAQILKTIIGLKNQVKNGVLPVKTITDTFNHRRSKQSQSQDADFALTYHRIGGILSAMGFTKAKTDSGASAIIWDEDVFSKTQNSCPQDGEKK